MNDNYRIVISIIRGTNAGRALGLMANGLTIVAETYSEANDLVDKYLDAAEPILATANAGTVFGVINILDLKKGVIDASFVLVGKAAVVRETAGEPGCLAS